MKVGIFLSISILLWSLYPLLSVFVLTAIDPYTLMLIVQFFAFHGALVFALLSLIRMKQVNKYINIQREIGFDGIHILLICGACSAFSHIFFLTALTMANKNGIALFFEIWPLMAVFFAPHFIEKRWQATTLQDYVIGIVAFMGIALIILSDENIDWFRKEEWEMETLLAYGMAIIASYMTAILNLMRAQYSQKIYKLRNSFAAVMITETGVRFIAVCFLLIAIFGMNIELADPTPVLGTTFLIGAGIFALGGTALTYALMKAENPNISLFFYLVPLLSVILLIVAGITEFTWEVMIGGAITSGACAYLAYAKAHESRRTKVPAH